MMEMLREKSWFLLQNMVQFSGQHLAFPQIVKGMSNILENLQVNSHQTARSDTFQSTKDSQKGQSYSKSRLS